MKGSERKVTSEAKGYAAKIQQRIAEIDFSPRGADSEIKLAVLEDVHTRLMSGDLTKQDAAERLEAGADHFNKEEPQQTDDEPPPPEFPIDSLLPEFKTYAEAVARGTLTDNTTAGAAVLGGVSAVVGTRILVRISQSWCYHAGLYLKLLAPSSYGKSSVIEAVDQPIRTLEANLRMDTADEVKRCRADVLYVEAQIKAKQAILLSTLKKGEAAGDLPKQIAQLEDDLKALKAKATAPVLVADDFTVEAIVDVLEQNDERVTVTSGDTGIFNVERYSDNPSIELLLKCWKGEPHREIRRGRAEDADLKRPSMAMLVATQVENVRALAAKNPALVHRGLLPRFLPVIPEDRIGFRDIRDAILNGKGIAHHKQAAFNDRLVRLARHIQGLEGGVVELSLDEAARETFIQCCQDYENRMRPAGDLRPILEAAGKLPLQLQKLIGINWAMWASLQDEPIGTVTAAIVNRAAQQLDYFISQQHRLYDLLAQAPVEALADKIRAWCDHNPGKTITRAKLRKSTARRVPLKLFLEALEVLRKEGVIKIAEDTKTGGRPSVRIEVL
jgi:hypothetical protein